MNPSPRHLFFRDWRGSVVKVTNEHGTALGLSPDTYAAFGAPGGTMTPDKERGPGYNGHESAGGLVYMRNRWYDPNTGRFTQEDPIGFGGGSNLYAYVGNNPVSFRDPLGLSADTLDVDSTMAGKVQNCRDKSAECGSMPDSLSRSTEYWRIQRGASGQCAPFIIGCTSHTPVAGHGPGGTITVVFGEFNQVPFFVNSVAVLGHELGHALTDRQAQCAPTEDCATAIEQVVRQQAGLPPRP